MPRYTVRMSDADDAGQYVERTVHVDAVTTDAARWAALSLYGSDAARAISVHNDDWGTGAAAELRDVAADAAHVAAVASADLAPWDTDGRAAAADAWDAAADATAAADLAADADDAGGMP